MLFQKLKDACSLDYYLAIIRFGKWQILYGACYACAVKEIIFVTEDDFFVCKNKKALYDKRVS